MQNSTDISRFLPVEYGRCHCVRVVVTSIGKGSNECAKEGNHIEQDLYAELQVRGGIEDNSKIIFLTSE